MGLEGARCNENVGRSTSVANLAVHPRTAEGARSVTGNLCVPTLTMAGSAAPALFSEAEASRSKFFEVTGGDTPKMRYDARGKGYV